MDWLRELLELIASAFQAVAPSVESLAQLVSNLLGWQSPTLGFWLTVVPGILAILTTAISVIRWLRTRKRNVSSGTLRLTLPVASTNINRYSARALDVLGREEELARLHAFVESDARFTWLQLAGVGGQGKSRLALELMYRYRQQGWVAGFLETPDLQRVAVPWEDWNPAKPHLIVLDYVIGREAEISPMLLTLARRADDLSKRTRIRILLLERQRWDRGGFIASGSPGSAFAPSLSADSEGRAAWFVKLAGRYDGNDSALMATRFDQSGVLELRRLEEASLVSIVRQVARKIGTELTLSDGCQGRRRGRRRPGHGESGVVLRPGARRRAGPRGGGALVPPGRRGGG